MEDKRSSLEHVIEVNDESINSFFENLRQRRSSPSLSISNDVEDSVKTKLSKKVSGTSTISSRSSIASTIIEKVKSVRFPEISDSEEEIKTASSSNNIFKRSLSSVKLPGPIEKRLTKRSPSQIFSTALGKRESKGSIDSNTIKLNEELEKIKEIARDKQKNEKLLTRMLPGEVRKQLADGSSVEPKPYENVTVYFSDIVGYTNMVSTLDPIQVMLMDILNHL